MSEQTESILERYLDGTAPTEEVAALEKSLREDKSLRKRLLVLAGFEADLPDALRNRRPRAFEQKGAARVEAVGSQQAPRSLRVRLAWAATLIATLAAALYFGSDALRREAAQPVESASASPPAQLGAAPRVAMARAAPEGRVRSTRGEVRVTHTDGSTTRVEAADVGVAAGETLTLSADATAIFTHADGSVLRLYAGTVMRIGHSADGPELTLHAGGCDATIEPQPAGSRWQATTAFMQATVIGTEFRLMADARSAWLGVRQGSVAVTRASDGQQVTLGKDNYAAVHPEWPFMRMNARVCPVWKSVCRQVAGSEYP